MWLTVDIGNSAVKLGWFEDSSLVRVERFPPGPPPPGDALLHTFGAFPVERTGVSSVVPAVTPAWVDLLRLVPGAPVCVVHARLRFPFRPAYRTPDTLGADRLAGAAGAWYLHHMAGNPAAPGMLIIDAGTAVTIDVVDHDGVYRGGTIGPGPGMIRDALHHATAQLPSVALELPVSPIGTGTVEALQSGILYGFLDATQGMIERISGILPHPPVVFATGGWAGFLSEHVPAIDHVEPHLVLYGIRLLAEINT